MLPKHKHPSLEGGLMIVDKVYNFTQLGKIVNFPVILLVISLFSAGFLSEWRISGMSINKGNGDMSKVLGK